MLRMLASVHTCAAAAWNPCRKQRRDEMNYIELRAAGWGWGYQVDACGKLCDLAPVYLPPRGWLDLV